MLAPFGSDQPVDRVVAIVSRRLHALILEIDNILSIGTVANPGDTAGGIVVVGERLDDLLISGKRGRSRGRNLRQAEGRSVIHVGCRSAVAHRNREALTAR